MNLFYIGNIRLPTEKAHGYQIMKTCEAIVRTGVSVSLIAAGRKTATADPFAFYQINARFPVVKLPVIDLLAIAPRWAWQAAFVFEQWTFLRSLSRYLPTLPEGSVCYTREPLIALEIKKRRPRTRVFLELHALPNRKLLVRLGSVDGIVALTSWIRQQVLEVLPTQRVTVIPDAVDLEIFDPAYSKEEARARLGISDQPVVVYGGRFATMEQGKGLGLLDEAVFSLRAERPDIRLLLVGGSVEEFRHIEGREPHATTTCVPAVDRKTLAAYYRSADVLAMPFPNTPHYAYEMSPMKMFEYMASGTPIVATDLPSVRDVLNEHNAVLIQPDIREALMAGAERLFMDRDLARAVASQAHEDVQRYTWTKRAENILTFIRGEG